MPGKGDRCVAVGCGMRTGTNLLSDVKMFCFPSNPDRRKKWENAVKLENWVANTHSRLCNRHFISGTPSQDPLNPDYLPTIFEHTNIGEKKKAQVVERYERNIKRRKISVLSQSTSAVAEETCSQASENIMTGKTVTVGTMTDMNARDISEMESKLKGHEAHVIALQEAAKDILRMESKLKGYEAHVNILQEAAKQNTATAVITNNIKEFNFYTKLPTLALFYGLLKLILLNWKPIVKTSLDFHEQLLLVLIKLRLGLINQDIAYRFGIQRTTVGCIFREWIQRMAHVLGTGCINKPPLEILRQNIPKCFIKANLGHVTSIIDCSEIFIDRPFNLDARAQTYSNYKHHNTVKFLISITPSGYIEFLSKLYGGRVSDKELTNLSGFINTLNDNDFVLADRGFPIEELVASKNAHLILPASTKKKSELSPYEVINSRKISRVRVHVERCIGRVKSYRILKTNWPVIYFKPCDEEGCLGDKILIVIAALCNFSKNEIFKK